MILVFFGAPGSGKGTQAQVLAKKLGLEYIATGNILRSEVASGTELGGRVQSCIEAGRFPSDDIIMEIFKNELSKRSNKNFLLDGIPRTLNQARLLDQIFCAMDLQVTKVVQFDLKDEILAERILGRFSCSNCGATYHKKFNVPKVENVCDFCGGTDFVTRPDDQEDVLKKRLELYYLETLPILEYYSSKGVVASVDASLPPEKVSEEILSIIEKSQ